MRNLPRWITSITAFCLGATTIYSTGFGLFYPIEQRGGVYIASILIVVLVTYSSEVPRAESRTLIAARLLVDAFLLIGGIWSIWRFMVIQKILESTIYQFTPIDTAAAIVGMIVFLELTRRLWGWTLFLVAVLALAYITFGAGLPGFLAHSGFSAEQLGDNLWFNLNKGVFGTIANIVINVVLIFVLFGVLLESTGAGQTLIKYAFRITRRTRGGPAHAAVVASSLFGTMSGSPVANIVGTGTFTIPLIKKRGFSPAFAAGVEATASCGGQIMPPIMGAAALVMADMAGVPYLTLIAAAFLPAVFYYVSLFFGITAEARKQGMEVIAQADVEEITAQDRRNAIMFVAPMVSVVVALVVGYSPAMAGFFALVALLLTSVISPEIRQRPIILLHGLLKGSRTCAELMISVAAIEIVVGVLDTTGVGLKFAGLVEHLGSEQLFLSLLVAMAGALILGMGMPTLPAYLIIVLIMGPAIKLLGLSALTVHLFVFYYGVASSLTPPVAIAAYVAAPIAGANPILTALISLRIGAAKFIIPFVFAYYPSLLLVEQFAIGNFLSVVTRLLLAIYLISTGLCAFDRTSLPAWNVGIRLVLAVGMLVTAWTIHVPAVIAAVIVLGLHWQTNLRQRLNRAP